MARTVILFSNPWNDVSLEELAQRAGEWGYQGLEPSCAGSHFEIQRAQSEEEYCQAQLDMLARHDLALPVLSTHALGQAVGDHIDARHQQLVPDYVWGDGDPAGVNERAAEEMMGAIQAAQKLGAEIVSGWTGSTVWPAQCGALPTSGAELQAGFEDFARRWNPILEACGEAGARFAAVVAPGQIAFDLASAELALDALGGREEFGFTLDPAPLHWQGVDPVEFVRRFPDRIYHVHINDAALRLNGRTGVLSGYLPVGDPRRGWEPRAPGHGGIDWEAFIRALNEVGYAGSLSVHFSDAAMERDHGAEEACRFIKRLDFEPAPRDF